MKSFKEFIQKNKKAVVIIGVIFLIVVLLLLRMQKKKTSNTSTLEKAPAYSSADNKPIAKVGSETIYQSDLNQEIAAFPQMETVDGKPVKEYLMDKLIEDSIVLQESTKSAPLSSKVYNSPVKSYKDRVEFVQNQKQKIESTLVKGKKGTLLSIWPLNVDPGKYPVSRARSIAQSKLTAIHDKVAAKTITIDKAVQMIKNDAELSDLDKNYKGNAQLNFTVSGPDDLFVNDPSLVKEIWSLNKDGVSTIHHTTVSDNEEFYSFAQVTQIDEDSQAESYEVWYKKVKQNYDIKTY